MLFDAGSIVDALARAIDSIDRERLGASVANFVLVRAAQAILYLGGTLSLQHQGMYAAANRAAGANFLWDDT